MSELSGYDSIAPWYDQMVRTESLMHDLVVPELLSMMGDVQGKRICDLACGQGVVARLLALKGASVVGVDASAKLLAIARNDEEGKPQEIVYLHEDAQRLSSLPDASFDGVICNMALMDIPDCMSVFRSVQRILRPGGRFGFSITHPCFQTSASYWLEEHGNSLRAVRAYFSEGFWRSDASVSVRSQVGAHHRTLSTYLNSLYQAGLTIEQMREPAASGKLAERIPGYQEVPAALVLVCRKA